jgi:hypothetical protein
MEGINKYIVWRMIKLASVSSTSVQKNATFSRRLLPSGCDEYPSKSDSS